MFSVTPGLATNASAAAAAAAAFNPYLSPVSPGLMPPEILPSTPVLMASSPAVSQVPNAAAAAAAQKLLRTDRLEVTHTLIKRERYGAQRNSRNAANKDTRGVDVCQSQLTAQDDNEPVNVSILGLTSTYRRLHGSWLNCFCQVMYQ